MLNAKGEIIMSWYCQMEGTDRLCMDWGDYLKHGWSINKSFTVKEYQGSYFKEEDIKERDNEKDL